MLADNGELAADERGKGTMKKRKPGPSVKRYDVEMIRDFLEHLALEVRILHYESINEDDSINPKVEDQLAKFSRRYNAVLLPVTELDYEGLPAAMVRRARNYWKAAQVRVTAEQLQHLEGLVGLFKEAFECIGFSNRIRNKRALPTRTIKARNILPAEEGGNPDCPLNRPDNDPPGEQQP
jgi:hypothetical protein